jgi:hypothetical protein
VDNLDVFGIDGTEFLDNKVLSSVASFYLIYRVTMLADGRRLLIYMDEFWQWINNEAFRDFVYNKLKTGRKLDMVLVVATQSPDELIKSPIAAAVREQCAHIFIWRTLKPNVGSMSTSCKSKSFILTKLKPLTRSLVSSWSSKTHRGRANAMTLRLLQDWIWGKRRITYRFSAHRNLSLNCSMKSGKRDEAGRVD